jgi:hypothetical protein
MGSFKPSVFHPLDLEIMDRVYDAAWAQLEAREPFRNRQKDDELRNALWSLNHCPLFWIIIRSMTALLALLAIAG